MSLSASEKIEVIRIVEESELSIRQTLIELRISRSSLYRWYQQYQLWRTGCPGKPFMLAPPLLE